MIKEIKKIQATNNLDLQNLKETHLSIQLSLDGFSFCAINEFSKKLVTFASYEFQEKNSTPTKHFELIQELFNSQKDLLLQNYKSVSVVHYNNLVAQVPKPFFDKNNLPCYLQNSVKILENDFIAYDELFNTEIVNVYIPFVNINNFLIDTYGSFEFKHNATVLIENLLRKHKNDDGHFMYINVSHQNFEIVVIKDKKLELYNIFSFKTKEDFIYYILFVAEQLNLNPEEINLILLGDIEEESELYTIVFQYIRNVSFYTPENFPTLLKSESKHNHFTLLNQYI
jgi:hypothetical protein